jgi:hypothetical protein
MRTLQRIVIAAAIVLPVIVGVAPAGASPHASSAAAPLPGVGSWATVTIGIGTLS